jgi:predicted GIY-YIG superfamily endonuclease
MWLALTRLVMPFVYILKCADGSYYTGSTIDLDMRIAQHRAGYFKGYTSSRLPVELVWQQDFSTEHEAFLCERQVKGWSRAKKEALIRGDFDAIHEIVKTERRRREAKKSAQQ